MDLLNLFFLYTKSEPSFVSPIFYIGSAVNADGINNDQTLINVFLDGQIWSLGCYFPVCERDKEREGLRMCLGNLPFSPPQLPKATAQEKERSQSTLEAI